ncbi:MAG: binding-protein-dependent transport system inner rane component [Actinobacteria bacterium]|nr:binding-protein-dependent transport system inner rane component [Actinomycetota bacterium]
MTLSPTLWRRSPFPRRRRPVGFTVGMAAAASLLLLFVVAPLLSLLLGTAPAALRKTLLDEEVLRSLALTFTSGAWATVLALLTGVPLAYLLARRNFPGKRWVEGVVNLPIVVPDTAAGIALLTVFGRNGMAGRALAPLGIGFTDATAGIVVGMLFVGLPFLVGGARQAFEGVDPELEEMAAADGASQWQAFTRVTLPLAWRGIASGSVLMWGRGISEFGAVIILAYNPKIVPVLVYERFTAFGLEGGRPVAVLLVIASLAVFVALRVLVTRRERAPVTTMPGRG